MNRFTIPRGRNLEVPLHAPDVLAAAQAINAYLEGYQLAGDERYLHAPGSAGQRWRFSTPGTTRIDRRCSAPASRYSVRPVTSSRGRYRRAVERPGAGAALRDLAD
ncbi:MAG: hypothetical protein U1E76_01845 [Planctomycetota bacterium]